MDTKKLVILFNKKKAGNISLQELHELNQLLQQYPEYNIINDSLEQFFDEPLSFEGVSQQKTEAAFDRLHSKISSHSPVGSPEKRAVKVRYIGRLAIAASFALIVVLGISIIMDRKPATVPSEDNTIAAVTTKGSKSSVVLPDGTKVWINGDTRLSYQKDFGVTTRDVFLSGEAYFDVAHDKAHPFIVHTDAFDIKVLGTAFNVKAYSGDANAQATLIRGAIEVALNQREGKNIFLKPSEKIVVKNINRTKTEAETLPEIAVSTIKPIADSSSVETIWVQNKLAFDQEPFENIARELERWYGVEVKIYNHHLKSKRFSGVFENKSVDEVLEAIQLAGRFQYSYKNNTIEIR
ncbi:MAG: DUF4974 domain-containing protein [Niabella sp.]